MSEATPRAARLRPDLLGALLAVVLATAIGAVVLELWQANLRVPFYTGGDATFALATIKGILEHGWYLTNSSLGAPSGQQLYDFPVFSGDSLYLVIIKLIGVPFSDPAVVENLFFLLCFPLIALSAYATLRTLRISIGASIVCAVLFTLLPYHFFDGESHIFQGSYFTVPLGCWLVIAVLSGRALFGRSAERGGPRRYLTWRSGATVLACIVMGSSDNYYAAFTAALVLLAAVLTYLAGRNLRALVSGTVVVTLILATTALNGLPTLIHSSTHGGDPAVARRLPRESDMYALSLADLVLPIAGDRIDPLARLARKYQATATAPIGEGHSASLGLIGTLGLLSLAIALVVRGLRGDRSRFADSRYAYAAIGAGLAFLIGTVGGLGTIFAYVVNPELRAWNRISVFIAFFALIGVGLTLDALRRRIGNGSPRQRWAFAVCLATVLAIGVLDQTRSSTAPPYKAEAAGYFADARLVAAIQQQLPAGASVFQLPYVPFPENPPVHRMEDYAELIGYLHSTRLRWSYGELRGPPSHWESAVVHQPLALMLAEISAAGFRGIYLDTFGYAHGGAALIQALSRALGVRPLVSSDRRLYFFNMAFYNQRYSHAQITR
jgi:phosphoglycerol transferase